MDQAALAKQTLRNARSQLQDARVLRRQRRYPSAFFHLLQATEELSKAVVRRLVANGMATFDRSQSAELPFIDERDLERAHVEKERMVLTLAAFAIGLLQFKEVADRYKGHEVDGRVLSRELMRNVFLAMGAESQEIPADLLPNAPREANEAELALSRGSLDFVRGIFETIPRAERLFELKKRSQYLDARDGSVSGPHEISAQDVSALQLEVEAQFEILAPFVLRTPTSEQLPALQAAAKDALERLKERHGKNRLKHSSGMLLR